MWQKSGAGGRWCGLDSIDEWCPFGHPPALSWPKSTPPQWITRLLQDRFKSALIIYSGASVFSVEVLGVQVGSILFVKAEKSTAVI